MTTRGMTTRWMSSPRPKPSPPRNRGSRYDEAECRHPRERGGPCTTMILNMDSRFRGNDEGPMGMTGEMDSRFRGNDCCRPSELHCCRSR